MKAIIWVTIFISVLVNAKAQDGVDYQFGVRDGGGGGNFKAEVARRLWEEQRYLEALEGDFPFVENTKKALMNQDFEIIVVSIMDKFKDEFGNEIKNTELDAYVIRGRLYIKRSFDLKIRYKVVHELLRLGGVNDNGYRISIGLLKIDQEQNNHLKYNFDLLKNLYQKRVSDIRGSIKNDSEDYSFNLDDEIMNILKIATSQANSRFLSVEEQVLWREFVSEICDFNEGFTRDFLSRFERKSKSQTDKTVEKHQDDFDLWLEEYEKKVTKTVNEGIDRNRFQMLVELLGKHPNIFQMPPLAKKYLANELTSQVLLVDLDDDGLTLEKLIQREKERLISKWNEIGTGDEEPLTTLDDFSNSLSTFIIEEKLEEGVLGQRNSSLNDFFDNYLTFPHSKKIEKIWLHLSSNRGLYYNLKLLNTDADVIGDEVILLGAEGYPYIILIRLDFVHS